MRNFLPLILFFLPFSLIAGEENVMLSVSAGNIYGTLLLPETELPAPVVLLIAGSGPTDRNGNSAIAGQNNSLKFIAEGLAQEGIATLRFDKRFIGESRITGITEADLRFDDYIDDVKLWIDLLAKDTRFSSITIAGHSEGSLIGMIAAENNPQVQSYISIAGSALPADEILLEQMEKQPPMVKDAVAPILEELKQGKTVSDVPQMLFALFRPSVQPYMISWIKYHPQTELKKLTIPVLILQGTTDIQIEVHHADLLAQANPQAQKVIIEGMNHVLKPCESTELMIQLPTYSNPDLPLANEIIPSIVRFIKSL